MANPLADQGFEVFHLPVNTSTLFVDWVTGQCIKPLIARFTEICRVCLESPGNMGPTLRPSMARWTAGNYQIEECELTTAQTQFVW